MANEFITRRGLISLGGISFPYINRTSSYTITDEDYFIDCSGTFSVTLPTSVGKAGRIYVVKNSGSGTVTVDTTASQTIDGVTTRSLFQNQSVTVQSNGANWLVSVDGTGVGATGSGGTLNYVPRWLDSSRLSSTGSIFDDGSNVGIGNTGPSAKLHITATSSTNSFRIRNFRVGTGNYDNLLIGSQGSVEINTDGGGGATALSIKTMGGNENFRVQENGIIRFRTASAFDNDQQLRIGVGRDLTNGLIINSNNVYDGANQNRNLVGLDPTFSFSSGNNTASVINMAPTLATLGGSSLIRGLYFNPTLQTTTGSTIRSIETVIGDVYLASSSGNVGIGVAPTSSAKLAVSGTISTTGFRMTTGATAGYVLTSDANGNASWTASTGGGTSLTVSDFQTGTTFSNVQNIIFRGGVVTTTSGATSTGVLASGPSPTVTVWIPAPPQAVYASHFNTSDGNTTGAVSRTLSTATVRISTPTSEGTPFETGSSPNTSWAGTNQAATTTSTPTLQTAGLVTGFSANAGGDSRIIVDVFRANGTSTFSTYTTPTLYQNATHTNGAGISVTIGSYATDDSGFPAIYTTKYKATVSVSVNMATIFAANSLDGGRYSIRVRHITDTTTDGGTTYSYTTPDVFYDTNPNTPSIGGSTTIIESTNQSNILTKHISGVEYYITGSEFELTTTGINNLNRNTQGFSNGVTKNFTITGTNYNLPTRDLQAWSPSFGSFQGWLNNFDNTGITFSYTSWTMSTSSTFRYRGAAAVASAQPFDPWGNGSSANSSSASVLIDQVSDTSSRLGESFTGETERLVKGSSTFSAWDSTATLGTSISNQTGTGPFCDACVVGGYLVRPDKYWLSSGLANLQPNLTTFKPDKNGSNPDYSSHTQIATYHRRFYTTSAKNIPSFIMTFSGTWPGGYTDANSALVASQLKIYIRRISSPTGNFGPTSNPLSMHGGLYNAGSFDDNGATDSAATAIRTGVGANNNIINATFGGDSANVGFWMELQIVNPDIKIDSINVTLNFADSTTDSAPVA